MDTPGNLLKTEREKQDKSLNDIGEVLKINIEYLKALEKDNYKLLPADVFVKSYLRSYSGILGLKGDQILDLYNKQFGTPAKEPPIPKKRLMEILPPFKFNYLYILAISIGLVIVSVTVYKKNDSNKVNVALAAPTAKTVNNKATAIEEVILKEGLSLEITASELTWISIKIDSMSAEELLLRAGETTTITANEKFVLKIGNAGGTSLILNGKNIGDLGPHGQLVDITLP